MSTMNFCGMVLRRTATVILGAVCGLLQWGKIQILMSNLKISTWDNDPSGLEAWIFHSHSFLLLYHRMGQKLFYPTLLLVEVNHVALHSIENATSDICDNTIFESSCSIIVLC